MALKTDSWLNQAHTMQCTRYVVSAQSASTQLNISIHLISRATDIIPRVSYGNRLILICTRLLARNSNILTLFTDQKKWRIREKNE